MFVVKWYNKKLQQSYTMTSILTIGPLTGIGDCIS